MLPDIGVLFLIVHVLHGMIQTPFFVSFRLRRLTQHCFDDTLVPPKSQGGFYDNDFKTNHLTCLLWQEFWTMLHSGMLARHLSVTAQEAGLGLLLGGTLFGGNIL